MIGLDHLAMSYAPVATIQRYGLFELLDKGRTYMHSACDVDVTKPDAI